MNLMKNKLVPLEFIILMKTKKNMWTDSKIELFFQLRV